jgi:hypothetical protein
MQCVTFIECIVHDVRSRDKVDIGKGTETTLDRGSYLGDSSQQHNILLNSDIYI